jgi:hypothetical protein
MAQVASQAEEEARSRLLAAASDASRARRLAVVLRTLGEAAGIGAREGRARLLLELLSVESSDGPPRSVAAPAAVESGTAARPTPPREPRPAPEPQRPAQAERAADTPAPGAERSEPVAAASSEIPHGSGDVSELRAHWADVVARANPVIKPLLKECRPGSRDGARLVLAFPEGRDFMRSRIAQRAGAIEALLTDMFGGTFAIECVASNLELEPLTVEQAIVADGDDPEAKALLEGVLKITGGELVDAPEVR